MGACLRLKRGPFGDESRFGGLHRLTYRLDGKESVVRMSFKPGATLPVKGGKVVTTPEAKS